MTVPSDQLLRFWQHSHVHPKIFEKFDQYYEQWEQLAQFSDLTFIYSHSFDSDNHPHNIPRIPEVIHQVWLGKPMPKHYVEFCNSLKQLNPDFNYKLWSDSDLQGLKVVDSYLFKATNNYGIKSDLLRYEILLNEGGWYFDCDFEAIRPLNNINTSKFNLILSPIPEPFPFLANGFMACSPSHPFIRSLFDHLLSIDSLQDNIDDPNEVLNLTGPAKLTKHYYSLVKNLNTEETLVLPTNFMYALPGYLRLSNDKLKRTFSSSDSLALHHWGCSWISKPSLIHRVLAKIKRFTFA